MSSRPNFLAKLKFISCETGPNQQVDDAWLAFKLLFLPWTVKSDGSQENVQRWFRKYLELPTDRGSWLTDSGRTALCLLLKSLNLPQESEVLIQGFSCVLVPNAVLQAGYQPIICEIDEKTYNFDLNLVESRITSKTRVWIVQHTFGIMPDMVRVLEICRRHNLILIEDCAHSLGSERNGQKAGTFGDAAIFSFGRDKIVSSTMGGLATINRSDSQWLANLQQEYDRLSPLPPKKERQALWFAILAGWLLPFYHLLVGKIALTLSLKLSLTPPVYTTQESKGTNQLMGASKYSPKLAKLLQNQLQKFEQIKNHRQNIAQIYAQELRVNSEPSLAYLRFPLNLEELAPNCTNYSNLFDRIVKNLRKEGAFVGLWYQKMFITEASLSKFNYQPGQNPVTERLLQKRVLNLPTNIKTSAKDAYRVVDVIQKALIASSQAD